MKQYLPRERFKTALEHREPDRVPIDLGGFQSGITVIAYDKLKKKLEIPGETKLSERNQQLAEIDESFLIKFGIDTRYVFSKPSANGVLKEREDQHSISYVDEWGTRWEKPYSSFYYDPTEFPLASASIDDLKNYLWPNPNEASKFTGIEEEAIRKQNNGFAVCTTVSGVFEQCWYLTGLERILIEIIENPKFVEALMDKVLEIELSLYSNLLDKIGKNIDMIELWEDISTQKGPLVSPRLYRKIIKPRTKTLVQAIKSKTNAKIALHSCGSVSWAIDDLIDIGIEVLNPVQVSAENMDTKILKNKYGNILSFWGGIDTQRVLPRGTVQEVEDEVKKRIDDLAPGGGYLLAPVHNIQPDVPPENIIAALETCLKYGIY